MKKSTFVILVFFTSLFTFQEASGQIINIPADYPTIQQGIDAAQNGDTVLVQPGTYYENINFGGKNIVVASLFLISQDTGYISQTIINAGGSHNTSVVVFENGEDSTAILTGFTLTNGYNIAGGGISCIGASPLLSYLTICGNRAYSYDLSRGGGGIYCENSTLNLQSVNITNNSASEYSSGGGIYCKNSDITMTNISIFNNTAGHGGGLYCYYSSPEMKNVTISSNTAKTGGGIYFEGECNPVMDASNRCNLYLNAATDRVGRDLYSNSSSVVEVVLDSFSVLRPTEYYAEQLSSYTFNIQNGKLLQADADLYVSPAGNDSNNGLTVSCPLKTIDKAMSMICADSLRHHTIHLVPGTYSPSGTGEIFPVLVIDHVSLSGESQEETILDAESTAGVLYLNYNTSNTISAMTITGGKTINGAGIYCVLSKPLLQDLIIKDNTAEIPQYWGFFGSGGGICLDHSDATIQNSSITGNISPRGAGIHCMNSNPSLLNVSITGNNPDMSIGWPFTSYKGGGLFLSVSDPLLENVTINGNNATAGGGLFLSESDPVLENVIIQGNTATSEGGGLYLSTSYPLLNNVTILGNTASSDGGGFFLDASSPVLKNVTIKGNTAKSYGGGLYCKISVPLFDSNERSNVYLNDAAFGNDLYSNTLLHVAVDTFSVMHPHDYHAEPLGNFTFDIWHGKVEQVDADLYVSPEGDNSSNGLSSGNPLKNIKYAFSIIRLDSLHPHTIHLLEGVYSTSNNEERYPLNILDYISLSGVGEFSVTLDAESNADVVHLFENSANHISGMTIQGGVNKNGISIIRSHPEIFEVTVTGNSSVGILADSSNPVIRSVKFEQNGVGISCIHGSNPEISNSTLTGNWIGVTCDDNSDPLLTNLWIAYNPGSGISCNNGSDPRIQNCWIRDNDNGIVSHHSNPLITNTGIYGNTGAGIFSDGNSDLVVDQAHIEANLKGGIACINSDLHLLNSVLVNNSSERGGGLYSEFSNPIIENTYFSNNTASAEGGGIYSIVSNIILDSVIITGNSAAMGGGSYIGENSHTSLENVTINKNSAQKGGGIYCSASSLIFDTVNRNSVFLNRALLGNDLFSDTTLYVVVDTFSVLHPTSFYACPVGKFSFDIRHGMIQQVNADLYVSPIGSDANSGISAIDPLKTIYYAMSSQYVDSLNPHTIHLMKGIYSASSNGECFPVALTEYLSLAGDPLTNVILDAEETSGVMIIDQCRGANLSDMIITGGTETAVLMMNSSGALQNISIVSNDANGIIFTNSSPDLLTVTVAGNAGYGISCIEGSRPYLEDVIVSGNTYGGVYCEYDSDAKLENVKIIGNGTGGLFCFQSSPYLHDVELSGNLGRGISCQSNSNPILKNVFINDNLDGGITCKASSPYLENVIISGNSTGGWGGGMYCYTSSSPVLVNVQITGNSAIGQGGGIACYENCFPQLTNVTLSDNISQKVGGAIYSYASSQLSIANSILWNDAPHEIYATDIDIFYSDIMGGREGQGNIDQDPFFISSGERPYALSASSPCINAGNPDTAGLFLPPRDLWGNPRIWDGRIDMGAYEWSNVGFDNQPFNDNKPWWTVFPNPAKEEVVLSVNCGQSAVKSPVSLTICDIYGKEVIRLAFNQDRELKDQVRIDASGLPAGIYLIRVRAGSEDATRKIVKL